MPDLAIGDERAAVVLLVAPALQDDSLTTGDVVALLPAPSVLLVALTVTGLSPTAARVVQRARTAPSGAS